MYYEGGVLIYWLVAARSRPRVRIRNVPTLTRRWRCQLTYNTWRLFIKDLCMDSCLP